MFPVEMPTTDDLPETPTAAVITEPADIERLRRQPALSERKLIDTAIRFANLGRVQDWSALMMGACEFTKLPTLGPGEAAFGKAYAPERETFREALAMIVRNETTPAMLSMWGRRADGLLWLRTPEIIDGKVRETLRYRVFEHFQTPPSPQLAYVLTIFFNPAKYGGALCRCQYTPCGMFFIVDRSQKNRPNKRYCKGHGEKAHNAGAGKRVQMSRNLRRAVQLTGRSTDALREVRAGDFDPNDKTLLVVGRKGKQLRISLSVEAAKWFRKWTATKPVDERLFAPILQECGAVNQERKR